MKEEEEQKLMVRFAITAIFLILIDSFLLLYGGITGNKGLINFTLVILFVVCIPTYLYLAVEEFKRLGFLNEKEEEICGICGLVVDGHKHEIEQEDIEE